MCLILLSSSYGFSQKIDYNTIILPKNAQDIDFHEKLIRIAWENNPEHEILNRQMNITNYELRKAKVQWFNNIKVSGNLNEFNIDPSRDVTQRSQFFPRYNVGAAFSLGELISNPMDVKMRREQMKIAVETINATKLNLRAEVLRRYEAFLRDQELLRLQTQTTEDMLATFNLMEQRFRNGEATLDEYNIVQNSYNAEITKKVSSQTNYNISKINLEELIGVKLEDIQ